ncbi:hypothetical protein ACEWY4_014210 [Coilia grayii]|uniref:Protein sel-1 homolog 3-like n=1 Tax=Coilia grayii TaxID=363190 RepID=A0ABD1JRM5_9TELE
MKVSRSLCITISFTTLLSLIPCELLSPVTPPQTGYGEKDSYFVQFDSVPEVVTGNSTARVRYQCPKACRVGLEVVFTTSHKTEQLVFRRTWTSVKNLGYPRVRMVPLKLPPSVVYKQGLSHTHPSDAREVIIRAWLADIDTHASESHHPRDGEYHGLLAHTLKLLRMVPLAQRPAQARTMCTSWGTELLWQLAEGRIQQCPYESDAVDMMEFPMVSTGEYYGVIRVFQPFVNRELETARYHNMEHPRMAISVWIYLLNWCSGMRCSIMKHVNEFNSFGTPLIMLTNTGNIVIQVRLASKMDQAFTAYTSLPVLTWIRLDCYVEYSQVTLQVNYKTVSEEKVAAVHVYNFNEDILYNDTSGYLVIGGSRFMAGFHGYIGPMRYYRLGTAEVINPLYPSKTLEDLDEIHWECEEVKLMIEGFMDELRVHRDILSDICHSYYSAQMRRYGQMTCPQVLDWDSQRKYWPTLKLIMAQEDLMSGEWDSVAALRLGRRLFEDAVGRMAKGEPVAGADPALSPLALLNVSSCLGHQQAALLLATVHLAGFGVPVDLQQGHVYSLLGAAADHRMALLHLGYKHMYGLDGFPRDPAMAYSYYVNIARQTSVDKDRIGDSQQYITESILISDERELQTQMGETDDVIQYIKLQAERGDIESQKHLAKVLFWGLKGVTKDIGGAVKWFAQSAMQMTDAKAVYDYSMLLLKGQGVKKNVTLGLRLMEKAAAMGSNEALNGLGWYYSTVGKDHKKALSYFQEAAQNGSSDAIFNVGVYHLRGHPIRNETAAFECFLNSSYGGHVDGAIEAAYYLSVGNLPGVTRDPERAVMLLKRISEQNGHLGYTNRKALQAYLQGSREEALLRFAMLAETGMGMAQSNAGHLCEELNHSSACQWRYYNHSIYNSAPHYSGLLKMGDWYGQNLDLLTDGRSLAMEMYSKAALAGSPQGIYNLAVLIEEGQDIPLSILDTMRLPAETRSEKRAIVKHLLQRCVELEEEQEEDVLSPCALSLLRVQVQMAWRDLTHNPLHLALTYGILGGLLIIVAYVIGQIILGYGEALSARRRDGAFAGSGDAAPVHPSDRRDGGEMDGASQREMGSRRVNPSREATQPGVTRRRRDRDRERALREGIDTIVTVAGVCLCALSTMLLSHLL